MPSFHFQIHAILFTLNMVTHRQVSRSMQCSLRLRHFVALFRTEEEVAFARRNSRTKSLMRTKHARHGTTQNRTQNQTQRPADQFLMLGLFQSKIRAVCRVCRCPINSLPANRPRAERRGGIVISPLNPNLNRTPTKKSPELWREREH